jgi:FlaA1/EpsC-like NDP-sugar epimerase
MPGYDHISRPALELYIARCAAAAQAEAQTIDTLVAAQTPVLIWGAGTLTRRLLATSRLAEARIIAFVDSNLELQRTHLVGRPVLAPMQIAGCSETIVIASRVFRDEIVTTIRAELRMTNPIVLLG